MPAVKTNAQNLSLVIFLQINFEHLIDEHIEECKDKNGDAVGDTGITLGDPVGDVGLISNLCVHPQIGPCFVYRKLRTHIYYINSLKPNGSNLGMHTQVTM